MNRSFDPFRQTTTGADADRGAPRQHDRGERASDERWRSSQEHELHGYGQQSLRGFEHPHGYGYGYAPSRADLERERVDRMRYERGGGALPSTYGNLPYDAMPLHMADQPWRGRDEEYDFWGQSRHAHAHAHGHPSLWERVKGAFTGHGPKNYTRADERIREDVCEHLFDHPYIDATEIEVQVADGEVTLTGLVDARIVKRAAEDCAEHVRGVKDVHNHLRVKSAPLTR